MQRIRNAVFTRRDWRRHGATTLPHTFFERIRHGTRSLHLRRRQPEKGPGRIGPHERLRNLIEEIELADQVGLDVFGLGEHHRPDYVASAPAVILAAAAARTKNIRLTSAVTVLSSDDPVRVFQQFATLDLLSSGRAEIMAGRGSFIESFPLFGYDLDDYDELFAEKLDLLLKLRDSEKVTLVGQQRAPINDRGVYPRPSRRSCRSGSPSAARRNRWCAPARSACRWRSPSSAASRRASRRSSTSIARRRGAPGHDPDKLRDQHQRARLHRRDDRKAADEFYGPQAEVMNRIGRERGWGPTSRAHFDQSRGPRGALFVGDPETVAEKIVAQHKLFGNDRFLLQMAIGPMPHDKMMEASSSTAPRSRRSCARRRPGRNRRSRPDAFMSAERYAALPVWRQARWTFAGVSLEGANMKTEIDESGGIAPDGSCALSTPAWFGFRWSAFFFLPPSTHSISGASSSCRSCSPSCLH